MHRLGAVTPTDAQFDAWYQDGKFAGNNPKSLDQYADDTNPVLVKWIRDEWLIGICFFTAAATLAVQER